ncbi:hypothetical protein LY78DRAFT_673789 [Colletotrichum sublineola]|nr:hypothetical protein LY78DRAFT_673789 [Colletotrichum sublineola]
MVRPDVRTGPCAMQNTLGNQSDHRNWMRFAHHHGLEFNAMHNWMPRLGHVDELGSKSQTIRRLLPRLTVSMLWTRTTSVKGSEYVATSECSSSGGGQVEGRSKACPQMAMIIDVPYPNAKTADIRVVSPDSAIAIFASDFSNGLSERVDSWFSEGFLQPNLKPRAALPAQSYTDTDATAAANYRLASSTCYTTPVPLELALIEPFLNLASRNTDAD